MGEKNDAVLVREQFERIYQATGSKNFHELAGILGVGQSSLSDARRRGRIPAEWLNLLYCLYGARQEWVLSGTGPRCEEREAFGEAHMLSEMEARYALLLRAAPTRLLSAELSRRAGGE